MGFEYFCKEEAARRVGNGPKAGDSVIAILLPERQEKVTMPPFGGRRGACGRADPDREFGAGSI